jgi:hypothetical protein
MTTSNAGSPNTLRLSFTDRHKPGLKPGDYRITVEQSIEADGKISPESFSVTRQFSVAGPRFTLDPQEIQEMFPPPGSLGEHSNVLPHIILKRSTLPWERQATPDDSDAPWLALLLFEEQEIEAPLSLKLRDLGKAQSPKFPALPMEKGDHGDDQLTVIDVPKRLLKQIIPTTEALKYLAHIRQNQNKEEVAVLIGNRLPKPGGLSIVHLVSLEHRYKGHEFNDQPAGPSDSIRLVSLKSWRFACINAKHSFRGLLTHLNHKLLFHFPDRVTPALLQALHHHQIPNEVRSAFALSTRPLLDATVTVSEYSQWRIADIGSRYYLVSNKLNVFNQAGKQVLKLGISPSEQKLSEQTSIVDNFKKAKHQLHETATIEKQLEADHWWIEDGPNHYFLTEEKNSLSVYDLDPEGSSTLRLPPLKGVNGSASTVAERYFKRGCVPLPHGLRQGTQTISWYHGPLTPGRNKSKDIVLPIRSADQLVRYHKDDGMFDVSYAAAWELGRLLTLQKTRVAVDLFNWKRAHAHEEHLQTAERFLAHLPYEKAKTDLELPQTVTRWFSDLALLHGVPFSYLVPDERLLPLESIRFFCLDRRWIECLLDGAFSVGRAMLMDHQRDQNHATSKAKNLVQNPHEMVTGLLLRSDVVTGWPGLLVDWYDEENKETKLPLRMERLSKNVLLCLFAGQVTAVNIHQKPETLQFGFNRPDSSDSRSDFSKDNRDKKVPIDWKDRDKRVVDISKLAVKLRDGTATQPNAVAKDPGHSAAFALDMIEGVESVRFRHS